MRLRSNAKFGSLSLWGVFALCFGTLLSGGASAADAACVPISVKCAGFEPNWHFEFLSRSRLVFTDPENPDWQSRPLVVSACARAGAGGQVEISTGAPLDLTARIKENSCIAPNDDVHPFEISIRFRQGAKTSTGRLVKGTGCCWR